MLQGRLIEPGWLWKVQATVYYLSRNQHLNMVIVKSITEAEISNLYFNLFTRFIQSSVKSLPVTHFVTYYCLFFF